MRHRLMLLLCLAGLLLAAPAAVAQTDPWDDDPWDEEEGDKKEGEGETEEGDPWADETAEESGDSNDISQLSSIEQLKGGGAFGLGFVTGSITGASIKIWPSRPHGIVLHVGGAFVLNSFAATLSYHGHFLPIVVPSSPVSMHFQVGPRFRARFIFSNTAPVVELGGGVVVGLSVVVARVPAEIFFEASPVVAGTVLAPAPAVGFQIDGGVGARFFF